MTLRDEILSLTERLNSHPPESYAWDSCAFVVCAALERAATEIETLTERLAALERQVVQNKRDLPPHRRIGAIIPEILRREEPCE